MKLYLQLVGVTCLALGLYLCVKDPRGVSELADVLLNPAIVLTATGLVTCIIALAGSFGALRDNVFLLKTVSCPFEKRKCLFSFFSTP